MKFQENNIYYLLIALMHGKGGLAKIKGSTCNISIKAANIFNILLRTAESNELIVVKLQPHLKDEVYIYFELIQQNVM